MWCHDSEHHHRADAGVIGDFVFSPTVTVDVNCATAVTIDLDNSGSNIDSTFAVNVYRVSSGTATLQSSESATQLVAAGATDQYATAITLPPVTEIVLGDRGARNIKRGHKLRPI